MSEATARPWTVTGPSDGHHGDKGDYAILDSGNFIIAECFELVEKDERRPAAANAALIVHRVNAHDALVAALELIQVETHDPVIERLCAAALEAVGSRNGGAKP